MGAERAGKRFAPRQHLLTRILPFWERFSIDTDYGGFLTHLGRDGRPAGATDKHLVTQARMIYSFATGAMLGGPEEWLNLARQGVGFLLSRFRDVDHDGWYWAATREGHPVDTQKRTYGHAFAAYALAEYGRIARDDRALAAADHTWSLMRSRLWDASRQGFFEACDRGWQPIQLAHSMGTHLHVLEALLSLQEGIARERYWPHVCALCDLIVGRMVDPELHCGVEGFHPDWTRDREGQRGLVDYGHNLEAAWLLLRVDEVARVPRYREAARGFLDYVVRFGLDPRYGGVYSHGPFGEPATVRDKIWWVQTEAIVAFLLGYLVFGDQHYWEAFASVADFCLDHLHDPEHGEWYASCEEDGTPRHTAKGSAWKAAYHITQACAYADQYLRRIGAARVSP